jgi:hypothetical protein
LKEFEIELLGKLQRDLQEFPMERNHHIQAQIIMKMGIKRKLLKKTETKTPIEIMRQKVLRNVKAKILRT